MTRKPFEVNKIEIRGKNLGPFCPSSHDGLRLTGGPNAIRQITRTQYNTTKVNNGRVDQVSALNHKVMLDHVILQGKVLLYLLASFSNLGEKRQKLDCLVFFLYNLYCIKPACPLLSSSKQ